MREPRIGGDPSVSKAVGDHAAILGELLHYGFVEGDVLFGAAVLAGMHAQFIAQFLARARADRLRGGALKYRGHSPVIIFILVLFVGGNVLAAAVVGRRIDVDVPMRSEECRDRAAACAELAAMAGDAVSKASLARAEQAWLQQAVEIEAAQNGDSAELNGPASE